MGIARIDTGTGVDLAGGSAAVDGSDAPLIGPKDLALFLVAGGDLVGDTAARAGGAVATAAQQE